MKGLNTISIAISSVAVVITHVAITESSVEETWTVRVEAGGWTAAETLAQQYGLRVTRHLFGDYYALAEDVETTDWSRERAMHRDGKTLLFEKQVPKQRVLYQGSQNHYNHTDPAWQDGSQSYLYTGTVHMNAAPAWRHGFRGEGVVVGVVDNGVVTTQIDLRNQMRGDLSFDVIGNRTDPNPVHESFSHGTNCAGVIAAEDNNFCGVGVAFKSKIAGIRIIDGFSSDLTDVMEASALGHKLQNIDIFSCSWGPAPADFMDGPSQITKDLLKYATSEGRHGKGNIYVFATGNGGRLNISCSYNGYVNQPYVLGISGIDRNGNIPSFSEACTAVFAVAYSRESSDPMSKLLAPYRADRCGRFLFGESSAAAPMAAGVVSLALSANPELTWRDVQHLIVRSSRSRGICNNTWKVNGAGHKVSDYCGFGLLDAATMTKMASLWRNVPEQMDCTVYNGEWVISTDGLSAQTNISEDSCGEVKITSLEHVLVHVDIRNVYPNRGHLRVLLTSPLGTTSTIFRGRKDDVHPDLTGTFMTVHHWGETPRGTWHLEIQGLHPNMVHSVALHDWRLTLFGTRQVERPTGQDSTTTPEVITSMEKIFAPEQTKSETGYIVLYVFVIITFLPILFLIILLIKKHTDRPKRSLTGWTGGGNAVRHISVINLQSLNRTGYNPPYCSILEEEELL